MKVVDKQKLPPGLPRNVLTSPWIPQQAVLGIDKIRDQNYSTLQE